MSKMTNFRLSDEAREILTSLSADWRMSQRGVVEKLLFDNDPRDGVHVVPDEPTEGVRTEGKIPPTDHKKLGAAVKKIMTPDTRTQQEKADDFYRSNMAKGKK